MTIPVINYKNVYMILWIFSQGDTTGISLGMPWTCRRTYSVKSFPDLPEGLDAWLVVGSSILRDKLGEEVVGTTDHSCAY